MEVQETSNKPRIVLYSTPGCEGCNIMISKVNNVINDQIDFVGLIEEGDITFRIVTIIKPKDFKTNTEKIYDFPTIQFIDAHENVIATSVGVVPYEEVCTNLLKLI